MQKYRTVLLLLAVLLLGLLLFEGNSACGIIPEGAGKTLGVFQTLS